MGLKVTVSNVVFTATQHNKMPQHLCGGGEWHAGEQVIPNGVCCFPQMQAAAVGLKVTVTATQHNTCLNTHPIVVSLWVWGVNGTSGSRSSLIGCAASLR